MVIVTTRVFIQMNQDDPYTPNEEKREWLFHLKTVSLCVYPSEKLCKTGLCSSFSLKKMAKEHKIWKRRIIRDRQDFFFIHKEKNSICTFPLPQCRRDFLIFHPDISHHAGWCMCAPAFMSLSRAWVRLLKDWPPICHKNHVCEKWWSCLGCKQEKVEKNGHHYHHYEL